MELIGAGARDHVDQTAGIAAELRGIAARLRPEFLDGIDGGIHAVCAVNPVLERDAVEQVVVVTSRMPFTEKLPPPMLVFCAAIWTTLKVPGRPMVTPGASSWSWRKLRPFSGSSLTTLVSNNVLTVASLLEAPRPTRRH